MSRLAAVAGVLALAAAVMVQAMAEGTLSADICYLVVLVGASVAAWIGAERQPSGRRLMARLIAAGVSCNALGEVLWSVLDRTGRDPDVSIADVAWFASYCFLCAALWLVLNRSRKDGRVDLGFVIDAVTIVVISVLIFWRVAVDAIVADTTAAPLARAVSAAYPILDAVLLALVLRVLLSRGARAVIDAWLAVGVCLWLAADILYLVVPDQDAATVAMNIAWMLAPVLMARAAWRAPATPSAAIVDPGRSGWVVPLLIAVCPLIVPPALELIADLRGEPDRPWQLFIGTALVVALAFVRTGRLMRSEQRAHQELEVARDTALAASEAKSMFLANMSHEIRTPLTTVLATGELLEDTQLSEDQLALLGKMHRSGRQLLSLVEGILDFSRIEAGQVDLHRAPFDPHALVVEVVEPHLSVAELKGIGLDWEIDRAVPHQVLGDRTRVFQVLNNLVANAVKFTEEGRVHVAARAVDGETGPQLEFSVVDSGIGIGPEEQAVVFDSFRQVDGSATRRYQGSGLGLAICKDLTELMGGIITVRSAPGAGSTFTVRLPVGPGDAAQGDEPHHEPSPAKLDKHVYPTMATRTAPPRSTHQD